MGWRFTDKFRNGEVFFWGAHRFVTLYFAVDFTIKCTVCWYIIWMESVKVWERLQSLLMKGKYKQ